MEISVGLYYKCSFTADSQRTLQWCFLSNVSIRMLGSCKFLLYEEFYSATTFPHKRPLLSYFYINIQKNKFEKFLLNLRIARYTKNLFLFLCFRVWNILCWLFHFLICMTCLLPGRPVIFTSCHLYFIHVVEYWAPTRILLFRNKK